MEGHRNKAELESGDHEDDEMAGPSGQNDFSGEYASKISFIF